MQFDQLGVVVVDSFRHQNRITEIPRNIPTYHTIYFLGRDSGKLSTQLYKESS